MYHIMGVWRHVHLIKQADDEVQEIYRFGMHMLQATSPINLLKLPCK